MNKAFLSLKVPTQPEGECRHCSVLLEETMKGVEGVEEVHLKDDKLVFNYIPERVSQQELESRFKESAAAIEGRFRHETWALTGLDCADCAQKAELAIRKTDGVVRAALNFASANLTVEYEPAKVGREKIISLVQSLGYGVGPSPTATKPIVTTEFRLTGLDCADCAVQLNARLSTLDGVKEAKVNFGAGKLVVHLDPTRLSADAITRAVEESGYGAVPVGAVEKPKEALPAWRRHIGMLPTVASGLAFMVGGGVGFLSPLAELSIAAYTVAIL